MSLSISRADVGDCNRCHRVKPGLKVFFITQDVTASFVRQNLDEPLSPPRHEVACGDCLSDSELAHLLMPVAFFVLDTLLSQGQGLSALEPAHAYLRHRFFEIQEQAREHALKALGIR